MADDEPSVEELVDFAKTVEWNNYVDVEEIRECLLEIRDIVESGGGGGEDDVDYANASRVKLVVVGDGAVGKTCLLISYATDSFPEEYVPTVFENYTAQTEINKKQILLHLWDTAGQEDYDRLRPLSYPGSDVVLLCFSLVNEASYEAIQEKWYPEVNHYVPNVPHILVGTKIDLRDAGVQDPHAEGFEPISTERGEELAQSIGAAKYVEVSAKTRKNLDQVFQAAVTCVLEERGELDDPEDSPLPTSSKSESKPNGTASPTPAPTSSKSSKTKSSKKKSSGAKKEKKEKRPKREKKTRKKGKEGKDKKDCILQ